MVASTAECSSVSSGTGGRTAWSRPIVTYRLQGPDAAWTGTGRGFDLHPFSEAEGAEDRLTSSGMVVLTELIKIIWGPNDEVMPVPETFKGNWDILDVIVLKYPIIAILIGLIVYGGIQFVLRNTKVGKIVRAGVEDPDMVQAMGHNVFLLFTAVFATGA